MCRLLIASIALLLVALGSPVASRQSRGKAVTTQEAARLEDFGSAIKNLRDTWVREFNAGHADKVAALYAHEAVLMRKSGSVHNRDSIQAELERSITTARGHNYTVESLHAEHNGDLGYDTGIYNEDFPHHLSEGNYVMVVRKVQGEWKIVAHAAVPNPRQK